MKRRSLLLMLLIVLLPIALLTWFGVRMAKDEQSLVQQRYRVLMEQRLQDVNRTISQKFQETERRLQQITSLNDFDLSELRAVVRREPQVTQLFVLAPDGELMYPNPADQLNGTEQSFLRQAIRMFSDRDLQNAVALTEAGALEPQVALGNRLPSSSDVQARRNASLIVGRGRTSDANTSAMQQQVAAPSVELPDVTAGGIAQAAAGQGNLAPAMSENLAMNDAPGSEGSPEEGVESLSPNAQQKMRRQTTPPPSARMNNLEPPSQAMIPAAPLPNEVAATTAPQMESADAAIPGTEAPATVSARSSEKNAPTPQLPPGEFVSPQSQTDGSVSRRQMVNEPPSFQENTAEIQPDQVANSYPESHGWFVWYWDRGMNLLYWQRRPSGHIVGAALERSRWIADLISWLPESDDSEKSSSGFDPTFRVITSAAEPVYNWGADCDPKELPYCEVPLATPLASWRLQCFVPREQITAGNSRSAFLGFGSGLVAFALTICGLAWILYRDYERDMREASQQVSFVNQVSHELKTPLTNIRMYAELLERDLEKVDESQSEKPRRRLDIINSEAQRLSRLIGNVLTFARQRKKTLQLNPTTVDPVGLVHQIAERFAPSLEEKGMQLTLEGQAGTNLSLDKDFVEQILGNLISNVEKYAASGRLLTLRTNCSAKEVTFDVIDAGPGIPSKYQSTVFEPFERLNNDLHASTGTGIGLSIARDLARIHGGDVTLKPSEKGCWFQVTMTSM